MSRSKQEIEFEVRWLTENKPKIPQRTGFGDDNHAAIEAQIAALVGNITEDESYDIEAEHTGQAARDAFDWLNGDDEMRPSESWKSLVRS